MINYFQQYFLKKQNIFDKSSCNKKVLNDKPKSICFNQANKSKIRLKEYEYETSYQYKALKCLYICPPVILLCPMFIDALQSIAPHLTSLSHNLHIYGIQIISKFQWLCNYVHFPNYYDSFLMNNFVKL